MIITKRRFCPNLCVTHLCNLDCVYCYQNHDTQNDMSIETAHKCIDWIFNNIPSYATDGVEVGFIGGEPLIQFELLKDVYNYTHSKYPNIPKIFYATTNGTLLNIDMKQWFSAHRTDFVLGLSLDGKKESHDMNRSNSFDLIDIDFFLNTWPEQGVKMTISPNSLVHLADNIKYLHSLGFKRINGVNLAEGNFDWSDDQYIDILIPQLSELVDFYVENNTLPLNQMFDKKIYMCESKNLERKKWCGIGTGTIFFDTDGKHYPCSFITPMTFTSTELMDICETDFNNDSLFTDENCSNDCYIYPICPICYGANYMNCKTFKIRDKSKCRIQKLIALFVADLHAKRILKDKTQYDEKILYGLIESIKKIRSLYLSDFSKWL